MSSHEIGIISAREVEDLAAVAIHEWDQAGIDEAGAEAGSSLACGFGCSIVKRKGRAGEDDVTKSAEAAHALLKASALNQFGLKGKVFEANLPAK